METPSLSALKWVNLFFHFFLIRTQFKKFLGKSVKKAKHLAEEYGEKAVNKVKSVRDEGKELGVLRQVSRIYEDFSKGNHRFSFSFIYMCYF